MRNCVTSPNGAIRPLPWGCRASVHRTRRVMERIIRAMSLGRPAFGGETEPRMRLAGRQTTGPPGAESRSGKTSTNGTQDSAPGWARNLCAVWFAGWPSGLRPAVFFGRARRPVSPRSFPWFLPRTSARPGRAASQDALPVPARAPRATPRCRRPLPGSAWECPSPRST